MVADFITNERIASINHPSYPTKSRRIPESKILDDRPSPYQIPTELSIRHATPEDKKALFELFTEPSVIHWLVNVPYITTEADFDAVTQPTHDKYTLTAQGSSGLMGSVTLAVNPLPRCRNSAHVSAVAVHPLYQGQGVGYALMQAVVDLADNWLNLHRVDLMVYPDNEGAIALYKKFGFTTEGILRDYSFRAGIYCDAMTMARIRASNSHFG
ncbi:MULTISPECIES: GNAT family N-acetyltransferase [unclassified Leptolyngbya]|uniref:GNAT family N-acetyltransferase n=1 Tax=unclassified Leptolyngbya TaxID=2650499 RepID=UPI001687B8D7|nr:MULTISPECIES: GNAT family N-acetyltransferase [unclassified Leptolyngbya]MBD1913412.1 GNAT family N-acetyltransferase [Leptolyngbya sp. FACHB-8]MBD2155807.1 GNAT family N-acetyltransferase [Leptolyngbya sp. FACHB-16]